MDNTQKSIVCMLTCWGIAALVGVVVCVVLMMLGGWMFMQGAFMGVLAAVVLGLFLSLTMCRSLPHLSEVRPVGRAEPPSADAPSAAPVASAAATSAIATASAAMDSVSAGDADADAPAPAAKPAAKSAAPKKKAPAKAKPAAKAEAAPAEAGAGKRPEALEGPRGGTADDLKRIKGVGPKMEKLCNSLGFYHFDQIAAWNADEVAWVDQNLEGFKGRVTRDEWVSQAKLLAAGGETSFSKKVDKGNVY